MNYEGIIKYISENKNKQLNELYIELRNIIDTDILNFIFYDKFDYEHKEIIETTEEREKRLDAKYRAIVKDKYKTCMITGKPDYLSQVAHIYPYALCNQEEKYDPENGFLLSAELHILFDTVDLKLRIDPETELIILSEDVLTNTTLESIHKYHNTKILLSDKNKQYLRQKYSEFINQ